MNRFTTLSITALLVLALTACGAQTTPSVHYGEDVRSVSGALPTYSGEDAVVHAYDYYTFGHSTTDLLATGTIDASGAFDIEFAESVDTTGDKFWFCDEDFGDETAAQNIEIATSILVMVPSADRGGLEPSGQIVLTNNPDLTSSLEMEAGDGIVLWVYSDLDQRIDRTCQSGRTIALDLKRGWNTMIFVQGEDLSGGTIRTGAAPGSYEWTLVPAGR